VSDAMAFVTVDRTAEVGALRGLAAAFREAGLPMVHVVDTTMAAEELPVAASASAATSGSAASGASGASGAPLDVELLDAGGVQTLGPGEMAIALSNGGAFDATPLDALLRGLGVDTIVVGGRMPSPRVSASVTAAELRGYRVLLATEELALTLGAYIRAA
jgi:nicotinamidase-related amidase